MQTGTYIVYMITPAEEVIQVDTQIAIRCGLYDPSPTEGQTPSPQFFFMLMMR